MLPTECDAFLHIWACMTPITLSHVLLLGSSIIQLSTWVCLCSWHAPHPPCKKVKWLRHLPTSGLGDLRRVWEIYHIYHVNDICMKYNVNVNIIYNMIFKICLKMIQHKKKGAGGGQDTWNKIDEMLAVVGAGWQSFILQLSLFYVCSKITSIKRCVGKLLQHS